jgi:ribosomal protein S18 acetylase RimI-like enzyme
MRATEDSPSGAGVCLLRDGRRLVVWPAADSDVEGISKIHPLPRSLTTRAEPLQAYYRAKAWLYVNSPESGVLVGWLDGRLVGFVFYCGDFDALKRTATSWRAVFWGLRQVLSGKMGGPWLWWHFLKWARQHFRPVTCYGGEGTRHALEDVQMPQGWIDTLEVVPDLRRLGIGWALIDMLEEVFGGQGLHSAGLWVADDNEASIGLFEKRGYRPVAKVQRIGESCWLLVKDLA